MQGLRALAVLAVVVDHLTGWPGGGFVGVDVFFVISGFLITGLLIREHSRTGRISFLGFYRRRVKRIVPAAVTVLLSTIVVGRFVLFEDRWRQLLVESGWAAAFVANWRFLLDQTDYFDATRPVSPIQHFWSLAVEEQFYAVWPWVMVGLLALARSRRASAHRDSSHLVAPGVVMAVAVLGSFVFAVHLTSTDVITAYFSSATRVWELGTGALLALGIPVWHRLPARVRPLLGWAGLSLILVSVAVIRPGAGFPAPWGLLPVAATALVLVAGTRADGQQTIILPLTNASAHYVGDISYSLYLWHFPVIILADAWYGHGQGAYYPVVVALTVILSVGSYHLIEDPLRRSPFLERFDSRRDRQRKRRQWRETWGQRYRDLALVMAAAVAVLLAVTVVTRTPTVVAQSVDYSQLASTGGSDSSGGGDGASADPVMTQLAADLNAALDAQRWPELTPSFDQLETEARPDEATLCDFLDPTDPTQCAFGDPGKPAIAIIGDSTAITLLPTMRGAFGADYFIKSFPRPSCTFGVHASYPVAGFDQVCQNFMDQSIQAVAELHPVVTFVIETYGAVVEDSEHAAYPDQLRDWKDGKSDIVKRLLATGTDVVLTSAPPVGPSLLECATRDSTPGDCEYSIAPTFEDVRDIEAGLAGKRVQFLDTSPWFCTDRGCPAFAGNTPLKRDYVHPTKQWAEKLAPVMADQVGPLLAKLTTRATT